MDSPAGGEAFLLTEKASPIEAEQLDFREAAGRWRKRAEQRWRESKRYDELAVEARRKAQSADRNAAMFQELVAQQRPPDDGP
jgi:hypothetical protein